MGAGQKVYLDMRSKVIKYLSLKKSLTGSLFEVVKQGQIRLPFDIFDAFEKEDKQFLATLSRFFEKEHLVGMKVFVNLSSPLVITRTVKIPYMPQKEIDHYLEMEIDQYLPVAANTVSYGYRIQDIEEEDGRKLYTLFLTSVPKNLIEKCTAFLADCRLMPLVVDVYANSILSMFSNEKERDIIVADVDEGTMDFVLLEKGKLFIHAGILTDTKMKYKKYSGKDVSALMDTDYQVAREMFEVIKNLRTYLEFYSSRNLGKSADAIFILGELSSLKGVEDYLEKLFQCEVICGFPDKIAIKNTKESLSKYPCNVGLAISHLRG